MQTSSVLKIYVKPWCQLLKNHLETSNTGSDFAVVSQNESFFALTQVFWG